jgi:SAM-dependent methyltransferase
MNSQRRRRWRLWIAAQMVTAARALEFFSVAIPRPDEFVACTRRSYTDPRWVAGLVKHSEIGLHPHEEALLDKFAPRAGVALVLGCGAGREAIALAKRGWQVVGVDFVQALIDAARARAVQAGVHVDWRCQDIARDLVVDRAFDVVCFFGLVYHLIPDRRRRVRLLTVCRQHLTRAGICLLPFAEPLAASDRVRRAHRWRRRLAWLVRGNLDCELGDRWQGGHLFFHSFTTREELIDEIAVAGFQVELHGDGTQPPVAILRPATTPPSLSVVLEAVSS